MNCPLSLLFVVDCYFVHVGRVKEVPLDSVWAAISLLMQRENLNIIELLKKQYKQRKKMVRIDYLTSPLWTQISIDVSIGGGEGDV